MNQMQLLVRNVTTRWAATEQWARPPLSDCLDFVAVEASEAIDARLRVEGSYTRNHVKSVSYADVAEELADVIQMCLIAMELLGADAEGELRAKLRRMDATLFGGSAADLLDKQLY